MKVLVAVKRVVDCNMRAGMSRFDEIAVEEAIRLKEKGVMTEIVVVSCGVAQCQESLRTAMAFGADRAILVETSEDPQPLSVAKVLKALIDKEKPSLVILGKQAIDNDCNQTGQMLAALVDLPQATFVRKLEVIDGKANVTREVNGDLETMVISLPAVITTDLRLNEPRHVSLPNVMKAKHKQLDNYKPEDLGVDMFAPAPKVTIACVNCTQQLRVPVDRGLLEVTCPMCRTTWQWSYLSTNNVDKTPQIPVGSHLVTPRFGYTHHGIYVGEGRVIHYSGLADGLDTGPVEETTIEAFTGASDFYVKDHPNPKFSNDEIVRRARSRIGEQLYCVFSNNCEHFCEWVINNDHDSKQVSTGAGVAAPTTGTIIGLASRGIVAASGSAVGLSGAGVMSGLASVGGLVGGGAIAGLGVLGAGPGVAMASLVNNTILKDCDAHSVEERESRAVGRAASYAGVAAGTAGSIGAVSVAGASGLSAAGITSGLAAIGGSVGGGMASGVVIATAAPVVAAVAAGYGIYKLVKWAKS